MSRLTFQAYLELSHEKRETKIRGVENTGNFQVFK